MAAIPQIRLGSWFAAAAIVAAVIATMLLATWRIDAPRLLDVSTVTSISERHQEPIAPVPPRASASRAEAMPTREAAPAAMPSAPNALAAARCATLEQRRRNPDCAQGPAFADARGRDLAPAPVEGVQSRDGALGRAILRGVNARAENYALGEAQKYADPREDPLYEEGTDPATAAMRPCPAGTEPRGDGRERRGRTCQPTR